MSEPKKLAPEEFPWHQKIEQFRKRLEKKRGGPLPSGRDPGDQNLTCPKGHTNQGKDKDWPVERLSKKTRLTLNHPKIFAESVGQRKRFDQAKSEYGDNAMVEFQYYCHECNAVFMPRDAGQIGGDNKENKEDQPPF